MSRLVAATLKGITAKPSLQLRSLVCGASSTVSSAHSMRVTTDVRTQPLAAYKSNSGVSGVSHRSFATGTRGSRGHGWYVNYRAGKGGRHLQGEFQDRSLEDCQEWNAAILKLGSRRAYLDVVVEPARTNVQKRGEVPPLDSLKGERHRLIIDLAVQVMPETCQNFIDLCAVETEGYKGSMFYRIEPKVGLCGGDVLTNLGRTGKAAAGNPLNLTLKEDPLAMWHVPGAVTMVVTDVNEIDSRFILCTGAAHHLDGINRAFGTMTPESMAIVQSWEADVLTKKGVPATFDLVVVDCGVMDDEPDTVAA
jgi:cyclophilin family peptidyl-prolyl cis-trans isomerase